MPLLSYRRWRHGAYSASVVGALTLASLQGNDPGMVVIEYRGPSNEFAAPIVLTSRSVTCTQARQILTARRVMLATSQCPIEVTGMELAALGRSLKAMQADSLGLNIEPGLLRATIFEGDSVVIEIPISKEEAARALDTVAQHIPPDRYETLTQSLSALRQRASASSLIVLPPLSCGVQAPVDERLQSRIINDLTHLSPRWSVRTLTSSNSPANRLLELTADGKRAWVGISYLASRDDAAEKLRCHLRTISVPPSRKLAGMGDEAWVMTESNLLFRLGNLVFYVQSFDQSLDSERAIARRLIASMRAR